MQGLKLVHVDKKGPWHIRFQQYVYWAIYYLRNFMKQRCFDPNDTKQGSRYFIDVMLFNSISRKTFLRCDLYIIEDCP